MKKIEKKKSFNNWLAGKGLSSYLSLVMLIVCSILGTTDAWASTSHSTHYGKATVSKNGNGTVYLATSNSAASGNTTETWNCDASSSKDSKTYYAFAKPDAGWAFKGWSGDKTSTNNPYSWSVSASSTTQGSPTSNNLTATFVRVFQFKAKADFATGSTGYGDVYVNFASGSPAYQSTAKEITKTQNGTDHNTASATETAYFYAQRRTGAEFRGWYSDAAGTVLVSSNEAYSQSITSSVIAEPASPQLTLYAKFEKVETTPTWALEGVAGTTKTLEIGETIKLVTETDGATYKWGTPSYVDASETNPVMNYDPATKTFTANRAGTVTIRFTQTAGEDTKGVLWKAGEQTFTFTVEKCTPEFAWADPLPHFTVGTTLPVSELFSFTPAECAQGWTLTSSNTTSIANIAAPATGLVLSKEADGVTLTFHQAATWKWNEIENTSIKINVTKEPVVFNWKNPSLIAGNTYNWTDFVETNSEGAWNLMSDDESVVPTMRSIASTSATVAAGTVTLSFTQGQDLGHDAVSIQTKTFTVYPADGLANFKVGNTVYNTLTEANTAATNGSNKVIIVNRDGVLPPGNYTISSGVTLLVPYASTNTAAQTKPNVLSSTDITNKGLSTTVQAYRKLTLVDGANIDVKGILCVGGQIMSAAGGNPSGYVVSDCGVIDMSRGGHIDVSGTFYAWGFVAGQGYLDGNNTQNVGTITMKDGSTVWENFSVGDWRGGTATSGIYNNRSSWKLFPFQSWSIHNIEVPTTYEWGATEKCYTNIYGNSSKNETTFTLVSKSSSGVLFVLKDQNSVVRKWYDPTTDLTCYELSGTAQLNQISIKVLITTVNSSDYNLPINSAMHLILKDCEMSFTTPLTIQPGAIFEIKNTATLNISSNVYVFDHDDWGVYCMSSRYFYSFPHYAPHLNRGDGKTNTLNDAKFVVDGTLNITGKLYTTAGGADIMGNGGGMIHVNGTIPSQGTITNTINTNNDTETRDIFPAVLHNENDTYTKTISSTKFYNLYGRWFKESDNAEKIDHTYNFTYQSDGNAVSIPAVYTSDKTGLMAGYKWVNVALDNDFCGGKTFLGEDGNYYYYDGASKDAVSKWIQLVKLSDALYSGSDNNLYTFTAGCAWASVGEIGDDCMYTVDEVKMALVGTEFIALEKDEYDEVFVDVSGNYYMLFDGCVWQHATKIPNTYRAYEVLGNPYIWMGDEWVEVAAEGAYFYTVDDQSIKHFYEFDDVTFTWVPVRNKVRVTTSTERRDFLTWDDAVLYLGQYTNPTITLLEDAVATKAQTFAPGSKSTTATIDLNGHKVTAELGAAEYLLNLSRAGVTLEVTDNSDKENGEIRVYTSVAKRADVIRITKGAVKMTKGKLFIHNTSSSTSGNASAIYAAAGQSVTMNGGELEAISTRAACGINAASSAALASSSIITMNGGVINATATYNSYGILSYGIINMNGGTINSTTTTVNGVAANSNAYGIYGHASVNATDANSYFSTINMSGGTVNVTSAVANAYGVYSKADYVLSASATDKTLSNKVASKINITGGSINTYALTSTGSYGVYANGTFNSYKDKNESSMTPHIIRDCAIKSYATGTAYAVIMSAAVGDLHAGKMYGVAELTNVDAYAETTSASTAAAVYATASNIYLNRARYSSISAANKALWYVVADNNDGDRTHEKIDASGSGAKNTYKYAIGHHLAGAKITVNSGTYYGKAAYQYGYGAYANRSVCLGDGAEAQGQLIIKGGTFTGVSGADQAMGVRNLGITNITGGTFNALCGTTSAYGAYGDAGVLTIDGGTFVATSKTTTAYGVGANGAIESNTGFASNGKVIVNDGNFSAYAPTSSTAYGAYSTATYKEITTAIHTALSADNKKIYYVVDAEGNVVTPGTSYNLNPVQLGIHLANGELTINGGNFYAKAYTTTAICAGTAWNNLVHTTEIGRAAVSRGELNIHGGTFTAETETSTNAECIRSYGITNVDGGTFNATSKTTTAYGVRVLDGTTTIDGGTFNVTAGTNTATGVRTEISYNTEYGYCGIGEAIINGGTFNVNTWGGSTAYGVNVTGSTGAFSATKSTGYTGAKPTDYAYASNAVINGGTFITNPSDGTNSYGLVVEATKTRGAETAYPKCEVNGGFFQMKGTGVYACGTSATEDAEGNPNLAIKGGHFSTQTNLSQAGTKNPVRTPYTIIACVDPEYKATYPYEVGESVEITFVTDNGVELWRGNQPKGKIAIYPLTNGTPERASDDAHSYEFTGWDKELAEVSESTTYTANFNTVGKKFMLTWVDDKGVEIDHKEYTADEMPVHADPIKEGYNFDGWTPAMYAVDKDQTYKAAFSIKQYTIRWVDEDGTLIREDRVNHGTTPTKPANPTKEDYSFSAWNPGVVKATEDATYTATYLLNIASVTTTAGVTTNYTSFANALTAAQAAANSTMTMLADVGSLASQSITKTFTLDLNGHTLSSTANKTINVNAAGITLTITDSKGGGSIETKTTTNGQLVAAYVTKGTLKLEGGLIHAENLYTTAGETRYAAGVLVSSGYTFNMTGGTVEGVAGNDYAYGVYNNGGTVNISGGTIKAEALSIAYGIKAMGNTTLDGVNIMATASRTTKADAIWVAADKVITINGGTYTATTTTTAGYAIEATTAATINVNGGKFKATTKPISNIGKATIKVAGGFFDKDTEIAGLASPKKVVALVSEPEKAEGYNYKIVDAAYQVTFKAENGTVLQQANIEAGIQPVYVGEAQTKASTPKYAYDFDGWMDASDSHVYAEALLPVASKDVVYTAHFVQRAVEYPITFSNIDGKGTDYVQMVAYDEMPVYNGPTPYMSGAVSNYAYTFIGWDPELAVVSGPATYTPRYDLVISHNVSFSINNASAVTPTTLVVAEGAAVERPADQLVDCQHIAGWYKDAGLNEEWNFASDKLGEEDLILYAKWETKTYTITWLDEFGDEIDQTVVNCGAVPTHANLYKPSTAAYSFEWRGWNKTLVAANADATYKSLGFNQIPKRYEIIFNTNGGSAIDPIQQEVGSDITAPANPTRTGYTFAGWDKPIPATMPAEDVTITASWTPVTYTITYEGLEGASNSNPTSYTIESATINFVNPGERIGYTFDGWSPTSIATGSTGDKTITASWRVNQVSITFNTNGGTAIAPIEQEVGSAITAPEDPFRDGYIFEGWDAEIPSMMPSESMEITAIWTPESGVVLDIVDWTSTSVTLNMNGYSSENGDWAIEANGGEKMAKGDRASDRTLQMTLGSAVADKYVRIKTYESVTLNAQNKYTSGGSLDGDRIYKVPHIISGTVKASTLSTNANSILYVKSGKLTIDANKTVHKVIVNEGAELEIESGKTLTIKDKLVLRTEPRSAAILTVGGDLDCSDVFYTRRHQQGGKFQQFALPYASSTEDVVLSNGVEPTYGSTYTIRTYNAGTRATAGANGSAWETLSAGEIAAHTGYTFLVGNSYYREFYFPVSISDNTSVNVDLHGNGSTKPGDANWNFICSPLTSRAKLVQEGDPADYMKITEMVDDAEHYWQHVPDTIYPVVPFYYQASVAGTISFKKEVAASVAARANEQTKLSQWLQLHYSNEAGLQDETNIYVNDARFTAAYETGYDVQKMLNTGTHPQIFTQLACGQLAFAAVPDSMLIAGLPLSVYSPATAEYTFHLTQNNYLDRLESATLLDTETGSMVNMLYSDYTVDVPQGLTTGRFFLLGTFHTPGIATGDMGETQAAHGMKAEKFVWNDHIYIRLGAHVYDVNGHRVELDKE